MAVNPTQSQKQKPAIELKSSSITIPVLRVLRADITAVTTQLSQKISQAPEFFRNAPIILDVHEIAGANGKIDLKALVGRLRSEGMLPVGIRGGSEAQMKTARSLDLASLPDGGSEPKAAAAAQPAAPAHEASSTRLVTQPIRSGQRVYAAGDLVILAQVSAGAEIMADGNIHVYGTLRGRALAGIKGNTECRIFCSDLQAELVSISGHYRISEDIDNSLRGTPVQIYLDG
ncbi:MAG: septum site-determining protein MinC, partial [Pseudomonadota bacterium]